MAAYSDNNNLQSALDPPHESALGSMSRAQHQLVLVWLGALTVIHLRARRRRQHYQ